MLRPEFVIVGIILTAIGIGLCIAGYNETRPTVADQAVGFLEALSGEEAPAELKPPKTRAYLLIGGGVVACVAGLAFVIKSRTGGLPGKGSSEG